MIEISTPPLTIVVSEGGPDGHGHTFMSWDDVNTFIDELSMEALKTFGPDYSNPKYDI